MNTSYAQSEKGTGIDLLKALVNNWPIVIVICSIIFSWAYFQSDLKSLQKEVETVKLQAEVIDSNYNDVSGDIREINAKLDIILNKVQL
jgi:hypothetical protein